MVRSVSGRAMKLVFQFYTLARRFDTPEGAEKYIEEMRTANRKPYQIPLASFIHKSGFSYVDIGGVKCVAVTPPYAKKSRCVLYAHGGGISQPTLYHWSFLDSVAVKSGRKIVVPLFPLMPDHGKEEVYADMLAVYNALCEDTEPSKITLAGDEAGGGIVLGMAQEIRDKGLPLPGNLVLLSPVVDAEMAGSECDEYSVNDPLRILTTVRAVGKIWADGDYEDFRSSPIRGDLRDLPPITIIVGSNEVVVPCCRRLVSKAKAAGTPVQYNEYHGMPYCFVLYNSPESMDAAFRIAEIVNGTPPERSAFLESVIRPRMTVEGNDIPDDTVRIEGRSMTSGILEKALFRLMGREKYGSEEALAEYLEICREKNERPYVIPSIAIMKSTVTKTVRCGMEVFEVVPKNAKRRKHIYYLHGGSFTDRPTPYHWMLIDKLAQTTGQAITVPLYPLLPAHIYKEAIDDIDCLYRQLIEKYPVDGLTVMGDSAGGGLSMALAQRLVLEGLPQPKNMILISPGLDFSMSNPEIQKIADSDPMLMPEGIPIIGRLWAGDKSLDDPEVSPLNGDISSITSDITLFTGTHDILNPDARRFRDIARDQGKQISYYEYKGLDHDFILMPLPEAKEALRIINELIS